MIYPHPANQHGNQPDHQLDRSKRREPFEVMVRRFNREIQLSGILTEVKRRKNFSKDPSRRTKKLSAIRKALRRKELRGY